MRFLHQWPFTHQSSPITHHFSKRYREQSVESPAVADNHLLLELRPAVLAVQADAVEVAAARERGSLAARHDAQHLEVRHGSHDKGIPAFDHGGGDQMPIALGF